MSDTTIPAKALALPVDQTAYAQLMPTITNLQFDIFYHPHVCELIKALNQHGIPGFLTLDEQQLTNEGPFYNTFRSQYGPTNVVSLPYPLEDVDFRNDGAYSIYNWELFFHVPLLIATRLSKNQQFEEAQKWFHYIFNPTESSDRPAPQRYWKLFPFYRCTETERIEDLLKQLATGANNSQPSDCQQDIQTQVAQWEQNPFNPHLIARMRLVAYQKTVVMKYIDNLIAWGDQLFSQDTRESVNDATQLYVLASQILGPRPERVPSRGTMQEYTYHDLVSLGLDKDDPLSNPLVALENEFPFSGSTASSNGASSGVSGGLGLASTFYFCIPQNEQLLSYWDTVATRLFNIRNCRNIEGVERALPLFAPPIDPALLVKAAAMGVDLASALNDTNAATPRYRFTFMLQKSLELCADVRALGAALLAVVEKKDAEALAALRASQEKDLLTAVRQVKEQQIDEAENAVEALRKAREVSDIRHEFYNSIADRNEHEQEQLDNLQMASSFQTQSQQAEISAAQIGMWPDLTVGVSGWSSPVATATAGFRQVIAQHEAESKEKGLQASLHNHAANRASILGAWARRSDEWHQLQEKAVAKELEQIDKQISAATIRAAIAQLELDNHDKQIENASAIEDFLREKYSNRELYDWMLSETSAVFFQAYKLAYDLAKRAEKAFRFERGLTNSDYIHFGYWDSLRKGLLSGEQLNLDLKRLEIAYLDQNKRDYEIAKHVSLVLSDPMALIALKETGQCVVTLPETLFDADYPGHYMRRLKSVSLTIPCVTGPYTSVNCTLTLLKNTIRLNGDPTGSEGNYGRDVDADDPRFVDNFAAIESIATSHAQNDSGMFELNFRDERYLPFEGAGAISIWRIEMPKDTNAFDFETVTDVVLNLSYTARDGGKPLQDGARGSLGLPTWNVVRVPRLGSVTPESLRMFSLKHEFPSEWYRFLHPPDAATSQTMALNVGIERFPFQFRGKSIQITQVELFLKFKDIHDPQKYSSEEHTPLGDYTSGTLGTPLTLYLTPPGDPPLQLSGSMSADPLFSGLPHGTMSLDNQPRGLGLWSLEAKDDPPETKKDGDIKDIAESLRYPVTTDGVVHNRLKPEVFEDIMMVCHYSAASIM